MVQVFDLGSDPGSQYLSQTAQNIGSSLSQGIGSAVSEYLKQKENERQLSGLQPLFDAAGLPKDQFDTFKKSRIPAKEALSALKTLGQQKQLESYIKSLPGSQEGAQDTLSEMDPSGTSPQPQEQLTQGEPESSIPVEKAPSRSFQTKPILATRQLPMPVSPGQIQAHAAARIQAQQLGHTQNKGLLESIDAESKKAKELRPIIKRATQIVDRKGVGGFKGAVQEKLGEISPWFKSPDLAEFQRLQKEMTVGNFRTDFGARPAQSEFFYITDVYGRPGDSTEALKRKLELEDWKAEIKEKREEIKDKIFSQYGEYPLNLNAMVEERLRPTYEKYLKKTGYDSWIKKQESEGKKILAKIPNGEGKTLSIADAEGRKIIEQFLDAFGNDPVKAKEEAIRKGYRF